jgi:hypothetical protein
MDHVKANRRKYHYKFGNNPPDFACDSDWTYLYFARVVEMWSLCIPNYKETRYEETIGDYMGCYGSSLRRWRPA